MAMMAAPTNMVTMPRKRRPRASAGEVFVTSESVIYLMDPKQPATMANDNGGDGQIANGSHDAAAAAALRDIIYENVAIKLKPKKQSSYEKSGYSCALRIKDTDNDQSEAQKRTSDCESQHVSIYIGKNCFFLHLI